MRNACVGLLLISLGFTLLGVREAGEAEQLKRLIRSKGAPRSVSSAAEVAAPSPSSPVFRYPQTGLMAADKITALPGQPEGVDFEQYAGYVMVDGEKGRALFYYLVESPSNSSTKPLVLWLNGGPGCTSLGYGAMQELGPFRVKSDGKTLQRNRHAWNRLANIIFLESPAGVGFSYSNTTSDYNESGDSRTAQDAYTFLLNWLERFPQYKGRDFFITGESYGGHYVPQLAALILERNKLADETLINLQGVAIGNAYIDDSINEQAKYDYFWSHAMIPNEIYFKIRKACNFSSLQTKDCNKALGDAYDVLGSVDFYNIYAPVCAGLNSTSSSGVAMAEVDPCSDDYVKLYMNDFKVQEAFHARKTAWESCADLPWNDSPSTLIPLIKQLVEGGLIRVWLYSGDTDTVCAYSGTVTAIEAMKLGITSPWSPWYSRGQVGGYVVGYGGLTFVTVKGAGHMVPTYQPVRSLMMLSAFLKGRLPPPA